MAHAESLWEKAKEAAGGNAGGAIAIMAVALFNRMFSVNSLNKRLDKHDDALAKGDRRMSNLYAEQRYQSLILTSLALERGLRIPPKPQLEEMEDDHHE